MSSLRAARTSVFSTIIERNYENGYRFDMTTLLEHAIDTIRALPSAQQDTLARILLQFAGKDQPPVRLTAAEAASFGESFAQADRGEFASDEQVRAIWAKHGL